MRTTCHLLVRAKRSSASAILPKNAARISRIQNKIVIQPKENSCHHSGLISSFTSLNLRDDVVAGVQSKNIFQPTVIQMLGIPSIMKKENVFCAAQTGSGKSFVYALPIVNDIRTKSENGYIGRLSRPHALVVAPTRELAMQILKIFKDLSYHAPIRSLGIIGQNQKKWTREYMKGVVDVVVGTPATLLKWNQRGHLKFSDLSCVVLDEADTLMDENFRSTTLDILNQINYTDKVQYVMVAATLPEKGVLNRYHKLIPDIKVCKSNLHKVLPHIKHSFVKSPQQDKISHVLTILKTFTSKSSIEKCVIFCNTSKSCNWLSTQLLQNNVQHAKIHGNIDPKIRSKNFDEFKYSEEVNVLVATDIASRGLDCQNIRVVVNFDCPFNTTDYLHRTGRTGRASQNNAQNSRQEEAITLITHNRDVLFAKKIENAIAKNEELGDIKSKGNSVMEKYKKKLKYAKIQQTLLKRKKDTK